MRVGAQLPEDLLPEIYRAAISFLNRMPRQHMIGKHPMGDFMPILGDKEIVLPFVPDLDICWGSEQIRPGWRSPAGHLQLPIEGNDKGRLETKDKQERAAVAGIFSKHLNMHLAFPDANGIFVTQYIGNRFRRYMLGAASFNSSGRLCHML